MYVWRHIPIVRLLVPFVLGVLCAAHFYTNSNTLFLALSVAILLTIALHFYSRRIVSRTAIRITSYLLYFILFFLGSLYTNYSNESARKSHFSQYASDESTLAVDIGSEVKETRNGYSFMGNVTGVLVDDVLKATKGKCYFIIQAPNKDGQIKIGSRFLISARINELAPPPNPYQFDYKGYSRTKQIYHQAFSAADRMQAVNSSSFSILLVAAQIKLKMKNIFKLHLPDQKSRGMVEAVVFGDKTNLDEETIEDFSKTGTIHVLAVSGLHVGIIYLMLAWLFGLQKSKGIALLLKTVLILLVLFAYAFITGFSPSVSRAVLMFGIVLIGKSSGLSTNIYNTLGVACFILLLFNPMSLFTVGFQFSFLAVLGIVYFQPKIRACIKTGNWFLGKVASLFSVSIAAQLATFPLSLYYFHQFPNLFFVSNILIIPLITVILYLALFLLVVSWIPIISSFVASLLMAYTGFTSALSHALQGLPYSYSQDIPLHFWQMILLYSMIVVLAILFANQTRRRYLIVVLFTVVFLLTDGLLYWASSTSSRTELFYVRDDIVLGVKSKERLTLFGNSKTCGSPNYFEYNIKPYLLNNRMNIDLDVWNKVSLSRPLKGIGFIGGGNGILETNGLVFLFADKMNKFVSDSLKVDVVILGGKRKGSFYEKVLSSVTYGKCYLPEFNYLQWKSAKLTKFRIETLNGHVCVTP